MRRRGEDAFRRLVAFVLGRLRLRFFINARFLEEEVGRPRPDGFPLAGFLPLLLRGAFFAALLAFGPAFLVAGFLATGLFAAVFFLATGLFAAVFFLAPGYFLRRRRTGWAASSEKEAMFSP